MYVCMCVYIYIHIYIYICAAMSVCVSRGTKKPFSSLSNSLNLGAGSMQGKKHEIRELGFLDHGPFALKSKRPMT